MNADGQAKTGQGAVIAGWICLGIGIALVALSPWLFLLYVPLFIASFVLSIVAMAQKRVGAGIAILLLTIVGPFIAAAAVQVNSELAKVQSNGSNSMAVPAKQEPPPIEIEDFTCKLEYERASVEGHLKNTSSRRLDNLRVTASYYADGKSLGSDWSIVQFTALLPGQTTPFRVTGPHVPTFKNCQIDGITEGFGGPTLRYTVKK